MSRRYVPLNERKRKPLHERLHDPAQLTREEKRKLLGDHVKAAIGITLFVLLLIGHGPALCRALRVARGLC